MRSSRKMIDICKVSTQIYEMSASLHGCTLREIRRFAWDTTGVKIGWQTLFKICHLHGVKIKWNSTQRTRAIS